jgi:hypothetical protein
MKYRKKAVVAGQIRNLFVLLKKREGVIVFLGANICFFFFNKTYFYTKKSKKNKGIFFLLEKTLVLRKNSYYCRLEFEGNKT